MVCQAAQARAGGRSPASVVPAGVAPQELFRRPGRFHSRLQNIEYECWVHPRALPPADRLQARAVLDKCCGAMVSCIINGRHLHVCKCTA